MAGDGPKIIIEGRHEDWPGGARTLTPREPCREPNWQTFWFGAEFDPDGRQVWFWNHFGGRPPDCGRETPWAAATAWGTTGDRRPETSRMELNRDERRFPTNGRGRPER